VLVTAAPGGTVDHPAAACRDRIVFESDRDGNHEIYAMNADGTGVARLTDDPTSDDNPVLSPDGERVLFVRHGNLSDGHLFVVNADGTGLEQLTTGFLDINPSWSPDGSQIVYVSLIGSDYELMVMNADGSGQHAITDNGSLDAQPDWSPDGTRIVFNRDYGIWLIDPDGSDATVLLDQPLHEWPHWSPDGRRIVFHSVQTGTHQIHVMSADGSHIQRLTFDGGEDRWPVWSTSGRSIAFQSTRDGEEEIYTMRWDGTRLAKVTDDAFVDDFPSAGPSPDCSGR
jgi:Tol biopolymer transport system component